MGGDEFASTVIDLVLQMVPEHFVCAFLACEGDELLVLFGFAGGGDAVGFAFLCLPFACALPVVFGGFDAEAVVDLAASVLNPSAFGGGSRSMFPGFTERVEPAVVAGCVDVLKGESFFEGVFDYLPCLFVWRARQ